jgi:hypothetical protein
VIPAESWLQYVFLCNIFRYCIVFRISRQVREDADMYKCKLGHWCSVQLDTGVRVMLIVFKCLVGV